MEAPQAPGDRPEATPTGEPPPSRTGEPTPPASGDPTASPAGDPTASPAGDAIPSPGGDPAVASDGPLTVAGNAAALARLAAEGGLPVGATTPDGLFVWDGRRWDVRPVASTRPVDEVARRTRDQVTRTIVLATVGIAVTVVVLLLLTHVLQNGFLRR